MLLRRPNDYGIHSDLLRAVAQVDRLVPNTATVAVAHAGTVPYYVDRTYFDLLGKCDPIVSRTPMHRGVMTQRPYLEFFPGHLKWDYAYSIGTLKPDFILTQWGSTRQDAEPHLIHYQVVPEFEAGPLILYRRKGAGAPEAPKD